MRRKARWSLLMVGALVLTACGDGGDPESAATDGDPVAEDGQLAEWGEAVRAEHEGIELTLQFASHPSTESFQQLSDGFQELTGITLNWDVAQEGEARNSQLLDHQAGGGQYDVYMVDGFWMNEYADLGVLEPLDDYIANAHESFDYEDISQAYREGIGMVDDVVYGIPTAGETRFVGYRTDLFEEHDLEAPQDMEALLEIAQYFDEEVDGVDGMAMRAAEGIQFASGHLTLMYSFSEGYLDPETGESRFTEPDHVESLQYFIDLLQTGPPDIGSYTHEEALSAFLSGQTAMWFDATALAARITDPDQSPIADAVDFVPPPTGPRGDYGALAGWNLSIPANAPNPDASWAFIEYMTGGAMAREYFENGGVPVRESIMTDDELAERPENAYFPAMLQGLDQAANLVADGLSWIPDHPETSGLLDIVGNNGSAALDGRVTAQEAAETMEREWQDLIG